jgi:hypothetical protein
MTHAAYANLFKHIKKQEIDPIEFFFSSNNKGMSTVLEGAQEGRSSAHQSCSPDWSWCVSYLCISHTAAYSERAINAPIEEPAYICSK